MSFALFLNPRPPYVLSPPIEVVRGLPAAIFCPINRQKLFTVPAVLRDRGEKTVLAYAWKAQRLTSSPDGPTIVLLLLVRTNSSAFLIGQDKQKPYTCWSNIRRRLAKNAQEEPFP
jgi:hypothetical protein